MSKITEKEKKYPTADEYIYEKSFKVKDTCDVVLEDDALEAVDLARRDLAWKIHAMICEGADRAEIDKYVTDLVDF
jgi:hypothetical protein